MIPSSIIFSDEGMKVELKIILVWNDLFLGGVNKHIIFIWSVLRRKMAVNEMIKILPPFFAMKINFFLGDEDLLQGVRERSSQTFPKPNEDTDGIYTKRIIMQNHKEHQLKVN